MLPFLFSWRLTVLLPTLYGPDILERMNVGIPEVAPERQFVLMDIDPTSIDDFEGEGSGDEDDYEEGMDDSSEGSSGDEDVEIPNEDVNEMLEEYQNKK